MLTRKNELKKSPMNKMILFFSLKLSIERKKLKAIDSEIDDGRIFDWSLCNLSQLAAGKGPIWLNNMDL